MLLQGSLQEFGLPNVLQLVKLSAKTGALTLRREERWGRLFFRGGHIYYALVQPQSMPLGERLVRAGAIGPRELEEALARQRSAATARIGATLVAMGHLDRETLAGAVRDQIEETVFDLLGWSEGEFEFTADEPPPDEDVIVEMTVDGAIIEGSRRIDEWDLIMASLGSLQHIPRLEYAEEVGDQGGVSFSADEWRVVSLVDGRRDAGSVIRDSGLNRFRAAKILRNLVEEGLAVMRPASIGELEDAEAVIVRSPIDFYTEVFLATLDEEELTHHLLAVTLGEEEVEVPMVAVTLAEEGSEEEQRLVFALGSGSHEPAWRELASRCVGGVLLVNANSADSVRASVADLEAFAAVEGLPLVVATYVSVAEDPVPEDVVRACLGVASGIPVVPCELRDRELVATVVDAALIPATAPSVDGAGARETSP